MAGTSIKLNKKITFNKAISKILISFKIKDRSIKKKITTNFGNNSGIGFNLLVNYGL